MENAGKKVNIKKSPGLLIGLGLFIIFPFCFWGINYSLKPEDQLLKVVLYFPALVFMIIHIYILISATTMSYHVDNLGLIMRRGFREKRLSWSSINEIVEIKGKADFYPILGVSWPGLKHGAYTVSGIGPVKMYATGAENGFLCLKTSQGLFGLTPADESLQTEISQHTGLEIKTIEMANDSNFMELHISQDLLFKFVYYLNLSLLILLGVLLGWKLIFSNLNHMLILLLILSIALFFFNSSNAYRIYIYSRIGACMIMCIGIIVNMLFIILSLV